jgi:hypothetical protein
MKKIMFSERFGLEQAVLAGTKTQTRRIIPIDLYNQTDWKAVAEGDFEAVVDGEGYYHDIRNCGKYRIGEEVAIAQPYKNDGVLTYNAYNEDGTAREDGLRRHKEMLDSKGYRNKMFVKAEYMPHRIRITGIKVERLQDISNEDAMREGVLKAPFDGYHVTGIGMTVPKSMARPIGQTAGGKPVYGDRYRDFKYDTPREAFAALIDRISGRGTWQSNPWVYAYTFELIK